MNRHDPIWVSDKMISIVEEQKIVYAELEKYSVENVHNQRSYEAYNAKVTFALREEGMPIGILKDISKGKTSDARLKWNLSTKMEDNAKIKLQLLKQELIMYQSINKHLEIVNN